MKIKTTAIHDLSWNEEDGTPKSAKGGDSVELPKKVYDDFLGMGAVKPADEEKPAVDPKKK